ncbi:DUF669 domain-containing protein [Lactobacillus phage S16]|nr:DUF669 domain-containing protein [Lactobacillus phage S16]
MVQFIQTNLTIPLQGQKQEDPFKGNEGSDEEFDDKDLPF